MKKNKNSKSTKYLTNQEKEPFISDLKHFGYLLPTNEDELDEFCKIFGSTPVIFPEHLNNADFLFKAKKSSEDSLKPVKGPVPIGSPEKEIAATASVKPLMTNPYFKNLVLAAEIATQLNAEPTFGHVKFFKIYYLCDQLCDMQLNINYKKCAAGPFDQDLMNAIDIEFENKKWFTVTYCSDGCKGYRYTPGKNAQDYSQFYKNYFGGVKDKIDYIINLFRIKNTDFCEIIATLYAVWKEQVMRKGEVNEVFLVDNFYRWNKKKERFRKPQLLNAISWMKENNITPIH
jgi:hypothetical protein